MADDDDALVSAAEHGNLALVKTLISQGQNVETKGKVRHKHVKKGR